MLLHIESLKICATDQSFVDFRSQNGRIKAICVAGDISYEIAISNFDAVFLAKKLIEWSNGNIEAINE